MDVSRVLILWAFGPHVPQLMALKTPGRRILPARGALAGNMADPSAALAVDLSCVGLLPTSGRLRIVGDRLRQRREGGGGMNSITKIGRLDRRGV